jgi:hypothetical protein
MDFIGKNSAGSNFDFQHYSNRIHIVVSPFVEWIWDKTDRLWLDVATPRILSAQEAFDYLETLTKAV